SWALRTSPPGTWRITRLGFAARMASTRSGPTVANTRAIGIGVLDLGWSPAIARRPEDAAKRLGWWDRTGVRLGGVTAFAPDDVRGAARPRPGCPRNRGGDWLPRPRPTPRLRVPRSGEAQTSGDLEREGVKTPGLAVVGAERNVPIEVDEPVG